MLSHSADSIDSIDTLDSIDNVHALLLAVTNEAVLVDAQLAATLSGTPPDAHNPSIQNNFSDNTASDILASLRVDTSTDLTRFTSAALSPLHKHTTLTHALVADTAHTAHRISQRVRDLDKQQSHVRHSLALIDSLAELKESANSVQLAVQSQDWELAAIHIQRFLTLDAEAIRRVLDMDKNQGSADLEIEDDIHAQSGQDLFWPRGTPDPLLALQQAHKSLISTIATEFDAASDESSILRFFKLFALVGEQAAGLDRFANVLAGVVKRLAQDFMRAATEVTAPTVYADLVTRLYEAVASLIDKQEATVERYYGAGRLLRIIVKLQKEVDVQVKIILDSFQDTRALARKVADINSLEIAASQNKPPPAAAAQLDPREVDSLINEIALISQRSRLFIRFLEVRSKTEEEKLESLKEEGELTMSPVSAFSPGTAVLPSPLASASKPINWRPVELQRIALNHNSGLSIRLKELMSNFATLQEFFLKKSIEKALKLDEYEPGAQTSSAVDDVFYIVKTSLARTFSTADPLTICTVLESVGRILEAEYVSVYVKRCSSTMGALETKDGKIGVLVALNNLDTSCDYIQKLVKELDAEIDSAFAKLSPAELERIKTCLASLSNYRSSFQKTLMSWVETIFNQMIKTKIRPTLIDISKDVKYVLSDDEYVEADAQDAFMKRFKRDFGKLVSVFKSTYSPRNLTHTLTYTIETILQEWERHLFSTAKFNALGALRFDKDVRSVTAYLSSGLATQSGATNFVGGVVQRDKFVRLNNMCALVNVEGLGEVAEVMGVSAGWRLSASDVKRVLALRVDFNAADIAQLKL
ncbi:Golgi transport complex subunit 4 [Chytriomyces hyalinus]|nr:Golgi transport complex subunit 4 [Chytriomyces hyalinus]